MPQGNIQASVRAKTGTAYTYEGDWHAEFDRLGVPVGAFNGRLLAWINAQLGTTYTEINGAMYAYAAANGAASWGSIAVLLAAQMSAICNYDFKAGYYVGPTITCSRASVKYIDDSSGNWTLVPANTLAVSDKGALVETSATNSIRNNSMQGAVAGSPGTLPTNWTYVGALPAGVTQTLSLVTRGGVDCLRVQFTGTPGTTVQSSLYPEPALGIAAAPNDVWISSLFLALVAGSQANLPIETRLLGRDGAQTGLDAIATARTLSQSLVRYFDTLTLANAATAAVSPCGLRFSFTAGQPVDITFDIGWPQGEKSSAGAPSSPIRTTGAAVTRAADVVTAPVAGITTAATLFAQGTPLTPVGNAGNQTIAGLSDGTTANREVIYRAATVGQSSSVLLTNAPANTAILAQGASFKAALAAMNGDAILFVNGAAGGNSATATIPASGVMNQLHIGDRGDGQGQWSGYVERVAVFASRVPDATLQSMTA